MPLRKYIAAVVALAILALGGIAVVFSLDDPGYRLGEFLGFGRYDSYNDIIAAAAARHGVDPLLVKAVIWQESRFHANKLGSRGERGLMQVTEPAAQDWATARGIETFVPEDLLDAGTNIEVGTWYLAKALKHWASQQDPLPFALGEYNAGRRHVKRWSGGAQMTADELRNAMDFPGTRAYVSAVQKRYDFYKRREGGRQTMKGEVSDDVQRSPSSASSPR